MKLLNIGYPDEIPFALRESINQLRVNLRFCGKGIKTVLVTSSCPSEGKSYVAVHLWKAMADMRMRTLFVDLDLRNSQLKRDWGLACLGQMDGSAHYLSEHIGIDDAIWRTNVEHGFMMPAGQYVNNPALLFEGAPLEDLFKTCRERFDCIIVDTAPIGSVADALSISKHCDGMLLVVGSGTPRKVVANSIQRLERSGCPILGSVLNRYVPKHNREGYYYGYESLYERDK